MNFALVFIALCLLQLGGAAPQKHRSPHGKVVKVRSMHMRNDSSCTEDEFTCSHGGCIPGAWKCDFDNDCDDWSDEHNCPTPPPCSDDQFTCGNGKCLPGHWKCDGWDDCRDGSASDETDCGTCADHQFTCNNGRCISGDWKCDDDNDCGDGSDEEDCGSTMEHTTGSGYYTTSETMGQTTDSGDYSTPYETMGHTTDSGDFSIPYETMGQTTDSGDFSTPYETMDHSFAGYTGPPVGR